MEIIKSVDEKQMHRLGALPWLSQKDPPSEIQSGFKGNSIRKKRKSRKRKLLMKLVLPHPMGNFLLCIILIPSSVLPDNSGNIWGFLIDCPLKTGTGNERWSQIRFRRLE
jgi:hypothetical protein